LQSEKYKAKISIQARGDLTIKADKLHMQSVIFNLLDNALKYNNASPVISIDLEGNEKEIIIRVRDNGIGISPEYRSKVFEKFFRVPHGETHNAKGYGLGLSYAAHVIERHKGKIILESERGKGSIFTITLPKT
jgi:two-component system phosphate regulon sensor histidine kinase PhoR